METPLTANHAHNCENDTEEEFKSVSSHTSSPPSAPNNGITSSYQGLLHDKKKTFLLWRLDKKYWIGAWFIVVILVLITIFFIIWYGVIRVVFQNAIKKVEFTANYVDLKEFSDPNSHQVFVEISLRVKHHTYIDAHMDSTLATLYYDGHAFGKILLPSQTIQANKLEFDMVVSTNLIINDITVFTAFARVFLRDDQVNMEIFATLSASAKGLVVGGLSMNRNLTLKGMKSFSDPAPVINKIVVAACDTDTYTLLINTTLDNKSQIGLQGLTDLNTSVYYEQQYLGYAVLQDGSPGISRGENLVHFLLTVANRPREIQVLAQMIGGIVTNKAQFYVSGANDYITKAVILKDAVHALNISIIYVDGLKKVSFDSSCDLSKLIIS